MISKELVDKFLGITEEERINLSQKNGIDKKIYMSSNENVVNSQKLLKKGQLIMLRPHPRFLVFPCHMHDFVEVMYVLSGEVTHLIGGNRITVKKGELLFLAQNTKHEIATTGKNDIAVNFIMLPEFFDSPLTMLKYDNSPLKNFIIESLKSGKENSGYIHFKVSHVKPIQNLVENLIFTLTGDDKNQFTISGYTMGLLFLQLINHSDMMTYQRGEDNIIVKILKYIDENYREGSLNELAQILGWDYNRLSREIKIRTGKTYTENVQERRLSQSCFMLKNTDMNVLEIAEYVGYDNISYFHRIFYKTYGKTPRKYRMEP